MSMQDLMTDFAHAQIELEEAQKEKRRIIREIITAASDQCGLRVGKEFRPPEERFQSYECRIVAGGITIGFTGEPLFTISKDGQVTPTWSPTDSDVEKLMIHPREWEV